MMFHNAYTSSIIPYKVRDWIWTSLGDSYGGKSSHKLVHIFLNKYDKIYLIKE